METISNISILVVDDEFHMRDVMTVTLTSDGFRVDAVASGREAIARLDENHYDLIICDLIMPDVDGLDVLAEVERRASDSLFILVTAHASVESAIAALRQGAYDYLLKPFDIDELSLTVQRALSHRQLMLEKEQLLADLQERNVSLTEAHARARQRAEALSNMLEASNRLARLSLHLESLAQEVVNVAKQYFQVRAGIMAVDGDHVHLQLLHLDDLPPAWQDLLDGQHFTRDSLHQFLAGAAPISRSYYLDPKMVDRQAATLPPWAGTDLPEAKHSHSPDTAVLAVPLETHEGRLVGVLWVLSEEGPPSLESVQRLEIFCNQAATALQNARLYAEAHRVDELAALRDAGQTINQTLDLPQVLELVVRSATDIMPVAIHSDLYLLDQPSGEFTLEASASRPGNQPAYGVERALDQVIHLATDQHAIAYEPNTAGRDGVWSLMAAPLEIGDTAIGVICLESPRASAFSADDQTLLSAFAGQASIAIQNASLFRDLSSAYVDLANSREEILHSRNTLQALFDGITDGLYIVSQDMEIIAINQAEAQRLGHSPSDLQGKRCDESIWGEAAAELRRLVQRSLKSEQEQSWVSQADATNRGPFADCDVHIYPVVSTTGPARRAIIFAQDVSEMRQLQASLFRSANLAAVGQLASSIAHEINNPLTVTIGNTQLLQLDMDESDTKYELTERILEAGRRMRRIVQNLLDFSSQGSYQFGSVELDGTMEDALMLIAHPLRKDNIHVVKDIQELPAVCASANHLKLVWMNLLLNARDAISARNGGGEIHIEAQESDDSVFVRITDNGVGIPPDHLEHLFRPFFTTKPPGKGLGLGLYNCHTIISRHQGQIHIKSQPGQGTTVCVTLPIQQIVDGRQ